MRDKYLFIDFEYNQSSEPDPQLVCCSYQDSESELGVQNIWLYKDKPAYQQLKKTLESYRDLGYIFTAYAVTAEARCFYALGLHPAHCKWIDLYLEFRQLRNCYDKYNYGRYYVNNMRMHSVPPDYKHPQENIGKNNMQLYYGLDSCIARMLKINSNKQLKVAMRDLILTAPDRYTDEEKADILEYCDSDIKYLPQIMAEMKKALQEQLKWNEDKFLTAQLSRGHFAAYAAVMESIGIPLDMNAIQNLRNNIDTAKETLISNLVKIYPFFLNRKKRVKDLKGRWVDTYKNFKEFVENHESIDQTKWKLTDSGRYCQDDQYLKGFEGIPEIKAYRETRKILGQLKWLRKPTGKETDLFDSIGSDGRMRTFFGIYGTQTARNAPAAKRFIFAMSAWLRCLIRPPKGYVITELDYSSQEFAIAAILSEDKKMLEAYNSGDPYLFFAKEAGAVPPDGTKKEYKAERNLFKATTLGLQYGMGARSLATKLSHDTGRKVSELEAEKLITMHQRIYKTYWRWLKRIDREYSRKGYLELPCGWTLLKDNPQVLSVRNFPTQGAGSSVIRRAVEIVMSEKIQVIATLHDSIYVLSKTGQAEGDISFTEITMAYAFNEILNNDPEEGGAQIRIDINTHTHHNPWISEKGADYYYLLKKYLKPIETPDDILNTMFKTIYK